MTKLIVTGQDLENLRKEIIDEVAFRLSGVGNTYRSFMEFRDEVNERLRILDTIPASLEAIQKATKIRQTKSKSVK